MLITPLWVPNANNSTVDAAPVFNWSAIEVSIGIIIAGLIELGPLAAKYNIKGFESYAGDDTVMLTKPITHESRVDDYEMETRKM